MAAKIMIVEDEKLVATDIGLCLEGLGYEVVAMVNSGEEAVELAMQNPPDAILMDIFLRNEMNGLQAAEQIRASCAVPVIFLTSNADRATIEKATQTGAHGYIVKPFDDREIDAHLQMALHRHQMEKANSELQKLSRAVEASASSVFITDRDGNIEYCNPSFTRLTGYRSEEVLGKTPRILNSGVHEAPMFHQLWQTISRGHDWQGELCNRKKNGELFWELTSISPIKNPRDEISHFVAVKENITARKQAEQTLERAKLEAEAANRAKSVFLANMSHEIRTPMNGIIGMLDLVLESAPTTQQRDFLEMARTSAESLLTLIGDILDFSKIEAGRLEIDSIPFNLRECVDRAIGISALGRSDKDVKVLSEVRPDVPHQLIGDPARLCQILVNLVANAVGFTEQGKVKTLVELVSQERERIDLRFAVSDTGTGIPSEQLPTIFEPFKQGDGSLTRAHRGSGLGLAICRNLVALMGGRIWAESVLGRGSTFHFTACFKPAEPVGPGLAEAVIAKAQPVRNLRPLRILLAEDQPVNQALADTMLSRRGHQVSLTENGRQTLDLLAEQTFDLVLMDVQMPVMDGLEATSKIRELEQGTGRHLPIIAMTAHAMKGDRELCLAAGMDDYVAKPIRAQELLETIANVLARVEEP